jgi:hypothetical protein
MDRSRRASAVRAGGRRVRIRRADLESFLSAEPKPAREQPCVVLELERRGRRLEYVRVVGPFKSAEAAERWRDEHGVSESGDRRGVIVRSAPFDSHANIRSVSEYRFTLTEHDPERPWIVHSSERRTITLEDGQDFFAWAREHWPKPRWTVELDPWQLGQSFLGRSR